MGGMQDNQALMYQKGVATGGYRGLCRPVEISGLPYHIKAQDTVAGSQ